ncbi:MAG: hypothetical protein QOD39_3385 [Mycobacterium sp.]|jgi:hypothetical protein|nr:hypothetical protein [Mycobacterium sp.]
MRPSTFDMNGGKVFCASDSCGLREVTGTWLIQTVIAPGNQPTSVSFPLLPCQADLKWLAEGKLKCQEKLGRISW